MDSFIDKISQSRYTSLYNRIKPFAHKPADHITVVMSNVCICSLVKLDFIAFFYSFDSKKRIRAIVMAELVTQKHPSSKLTLFISSIPKASKISTIA